MYISYKEKNISEEQRKKHNEKYIKNQLKEEKEYFDNMFKEIDNNIFLDENQRRIILTNEKYTMVIAGAGSGKTTTISAKVNYLIEKQNIKDEEILIISFTNKAVEELRDKINNDFKHNVKVTTFHKFGYQIIKDNTNNYKKINTNDNVLKKSILKAAKKQKEKSNNIAKHIKKIIKTIKSKIIGLAETKIDVEQLNICKQYISLYKSKTKDKEKYIHPKYIKEIYHEYEHQLEKNNMMDFDDIINQANKIIEIKENLKYEYKYIIIDEYQDISENRYNLIQNIAKKTNAKIMVVGDDWQCIYSFASSNINLFTNFKNNVEYCEILKIEKTYRNSQQLIDIAGEFVQKNNKQIKKQLTSNKQLNNPITLAIYKEDKKEEIQKALITSMEYIIKKYGTNKNILILGRYRFDKKIILNNEIKEDINNKIIYKKYKDTKIEYLTVHSSKGLGYDNVILINAKNEKMGFPSKAKTNKLIKPLINEDDGIRYAEERRLFYVALTRTKNEIIILTPKNNYSEFIKEIKNKCNKIKIK